MCALRGAPEVRGAWRGPRGRGRGGVEVQRECTFCHTYVRHFQCAVTTDCDCVAGVGGSSTVCV